MVVQGRDAVAVIKAESLEMGKPGGIKMYVIDKKNRNVYIFDLGLKLWEFSRLMTKLVADRTIWLEVPLTEMANTREKEYLGVCQEGEISVLDIFNLKCK